MTKSQFIAVIPLSTSRKCFEHLVHGKKPPS